MKLTDQQPLFVGFKLDGSLRHQLEGLSGPDRQYVSGEEGTAFLTICKNDGVKYVGKIVHDRLTTDRVDDVRRNVLSIVTRLCPDIRLPTILQIWVCAPPEPEPEPQPVTPPDRRNFY